MLICSVQDTNSKETVSIIIWVVLKKLVELFVLSVLTKPKLRALSMIDILLLLSQLVV